MKADLHAYSFRPATTDDLARLRRWLHTPEVKRWWGSPSEQFELLRDDLDEPRMSMRIVSFDGRPFAYAQDYEVHAWPQPHLASLKAMFALGALMRWPGFASKRPLRLRLARPS
jgi:aminoglycoside 6'-N-acetyltransferase